jgi:hypothetical protein
MFNISHPLLEMRLDLGFVPGHGVVAVIQTFQFLPPVATVQCLLECLRSKFACTTKSQLAATDGADAGDNGPLRKQLISICVLLGIAIMFMKLQSHAEK